MRVSVPLTHLFGATASVPRCSSVSRVMATVVGGRLRVVCRRYVDDFGTASFESCVHMVRDAFDQSNPFLGFKLETEKFEFAVFLELQGATANFSFANKRCLAHLSFSATRAETLMSEIALRLKYQEAFPPHMRKLEGKSNFNRTAVMAKVTMRPRNAN